ncbi:MAG: hypothetical protein DA446_03635 [Bacteroidetes bacterium]|nr:MAG: hypothetical protein DA443_00385 [Bacteroidota bacterium]PTM20372.1 MAG: hypothetical protein DA446_03635 [Bacteroidota bacterium]
MDHNYESDFGRRLPIITVSRLRNEKISYLLRHFEIIFYLSKIDHGNATIALGVDSFAFELRELSDHI